MISFNFICHEKGAKTHGCRQRQRHRQYPERQLFQRQLFSPMGSAAPHLHELFCCCPNQAQSALHAVLIVAFFDVEAD